MCVCLIHQWLTTVLFRAVSVSGSAGEEMQSPAAVPVPVCACACVCERKYKSSRCIFSVFFYIFDITFYLKKKHDVCRWFTYSSVLNMSCFRPPLLLPLESVLQPWPVILTSDSCRQKSVYLCFFWLPTYSSYLRCTITTWLLGFFFPRASESFAPLGQQDARFYCPPFPHLMHVLMPRPSCQEEWANYSKMFYFSFGI